MRKILHIPIHNSEIFIHIFHQLQGKRKKSLQHYIMNPNFHTIQTEHNKFLNHSHSERPQAQLYSSHSPTLNQTQVVEQKANIKQEVAKIQSSLVNSLRLQRQSYDSNINFLINFTLKSRKNHVKSKDNRLELTSGAFLFSQRKKDEENGRKKQMDINQQKKMKIENSEIEKGSSIISNGIQQLESQRKKNSYIETGTSEKLKNSIRKSVPTQPISERRRSKEFKLDQNEQDEMINFKPRSWEENLNLYNQSQKSEALGSIKKKEKLSENYFSIISKIIQEKFKRNANLPKGEFFVQMNKTWRQLKSKEKKNNYLKTIKLRRQYRCSENFNSENACNTVTGQNRIQLQISNEIPPPFLQTLQCFYTNRKYAQSRKQSVEGLKLNLDKVKNISSQFSEEKARCCQNSAIRTPERSVFNRKDLRICEKVAYVEWERRRIKQSKKISPKQVGRVKQDGREERGGRQVGRIIQYF